MIQPKRVLIGIQARSNSQRLPGKIHKEIDRKPILQHVIETCKRAATYINNNQSRLGADVKVCLLIPEGDEEILRRYKRTTDISEGDENDVLSRYASLGTFGLYDFIVRVTSDCLELPSHVITGAIRTALIQQADYTTNTWIRTYPEGWDIEVLTRRLLEWLNEKALAPDEREHVTSFLRKVKFPYMKDQRPSIYHILNHTDESDRKTSIDTLEEYEAAVKRFEKMNQKKREARNNGYYFT